jgi:hypothetical protein
VVCVAYRVDNPFRCLGVGGKDATLLGMHDDVLVRIFSYLSLEQVVCNVANVCYRCYQVTQSPRLFEEIDLSRQQTLDDESFVDLLCELGWSTLRVLTPPPRMKARGIHALVTCTSLQVRHARTHTL